MKFDIFNIKDKPRLRLNSLEIRKQLKMLLIEIKSLIEEIILWMLIHIFSHRNIKKRETSFSFIQKKNTNKILKTRNISEAIIMMLKIHVTYWYISL